MRAVKKKFILFYMSVKINKFQHQDEVPLRISIPVPVC